MLNVLWIAYQPIPDIIKELHEEGIATGGWLQGAADMISENDDMNLSYCFQYKKQIEGKIGNLSYYTMGIVPEIHRKAINIYRKEDFNRFKNIIQKSNPDIIHIFGTEKWFQRQFVLMAYDLGLIDKTVIWIQGLTSFCSETYTNGLTVKQANKTTLWEFLRGTNIYGIQKRLALNGKSEKEIIKQTKNVFVRTDWDSACCRAMNPGVKLYYCNETLRPAFYDNVKWKIENVKKHSIFMSQYSTPIKGYHQVLKALSIVLREFPDTVLYTTGSDLLEESKFLIDKIREPGYFKILRDEIKSNGLEKNVRYLGTLQEKDMRDQYVRSHVFISASTIENSPNSLGEAMILGVPTVASNVGGVSSMMADKEEGYLYPFNDYAVMAEYICKIFRDDTLAVTLSEKAKKRAQITHNREKNYKTLLACYQDILVSGE